MAESYKWTFNNTPIKFSKETKAEIKKRVTEYIDSSEKLKEKVSRIDVKAGRVYLYHLVAQFNTEGHTLIKPLIDDKYCEFIFGRITLYDSKGQKSTADWQRHNGQWFNFHEGTLEDCLAFMEKNTWFS